ncbi:MAG: hypothetical protein ACXVP3_06685 [Actinomycetota bacterium]
MSVRRRLGAALAALTLAAAACTLTVGSRPLATPALGPQPSPSPVPTGPHSAAATMQRLCEAPKAGSGGSGVTPEGPTPPAIATVEHEVETVRGLTYTSRVGVEPVTQAQIDRRLAKSFDKTNPVDADARRSQAWATIGVIPPGTSLHRALLAFTTGQVVGYYNSETKKLVYLGDTQLSLNERFILAHELTHAIDDQHFGLSRLDGIAAHCDDEAFMAALGAVEGSAQFFATQVILRFPNTGTGGASGSTGGGSLAGVPPFLSNIELWPYTVGMAFIQRLDAEGGSARVNQALRHFPVSTEQVIHPDRYPGDVPQPVDVPDLAPKLGLGWKDLDVETIGEAWLQIMLDLRLDADTASTAATGWDGGLYRAWSDGSRTAVVLRTVWDTPQDAVEFADAVTRWIGNGTATVVGPDGAWVDVLFGSDAGTLARLRRAVG